VPRFLLVPVDGCEFGVTMKLSRWYQVPISGRDVSCHEKTVKMASKKLSTSASARQPKDAVPRNETVRVQQYFINGTEFSSIDFGAGYKAVMGWWKALN
jgi:hypothetical protein